MPSFVILSVVVNLAVVVIVGRLVVVLVVRFVVLVVLFVVPRVVLVFLNDVLFLGTKANVINLIIVIRGYLIYSMRNLFVLRTHGYTFRINKHASSRNISILVS